MLVGIHQLHYLPWLRYIEKMDRADVFVVLDNIQYNKNGWQNRNKVKTAVGATLLTVPVSTGLGATLDEVEIPEGQPWAKKHWKTIENAYGAAPHFEAHAEFLRDTYARTWDRLNDLNRHMLAYYVDTLGIETRVAYASELDAPGEATERLINLIRAVGGTAYYSGAYALESYLDAKALEAAGIELVLQEWSAPEYPQRYGDFVPDLAVIDVLMNCGPDALDVIRSGAR